MQSKIEAIRVPSCGGTVLVEVQHETSGAIAALTFISGAELVTLYAGTKELKQLAAALSAAAAALEAP